MDIDPQQYKELPERAVLQFPELVWFGQSPLFELYAGSFSPIVPTVAGAVFDLKLPVFRQNAKMFRIKWNVNAWFKPNATIAPIGGSSIEASIIKFTGSTPSDISFNDSPFYFSMDPKIFFTQMSDTLSNVRLKNLNLIFTVRPSDLAPNVSYAPNPAANTNFFFTMRPTIIAMF